MKIILKHILSFFADIYYLIAWKYSKNRKRHTCLNNDNRVEKIVVSLTTFPGRIHIVHKTIQCALNQSSIKPDVVELWLAKEQFPNREEDLPRELLDLRDYGLLISWCEDLKSYKKLVPAVKKYKNDIIVTIDDDVYYSSNWLKKLYLAYLQDNNKVYCHRVTKFSYENNKYSFVGGGREYYKKSSFLNKLVGVGGVLYPPNSLHKDIIRDDLFMRIAPTNDDIWFWFMAIKNGFRIAVVKGNEARPIAVYKAENTEKLTNINDNGEKLFLKQFVALLKCFPEVESILENEYNRIRETEGDC